MLLRTVLFATSVAVVVSHPTADSCADQAACLRVAAFDCGADGFRDVCLFWEPGADGCAKERGSAFRRAVVYGNENEDRPWPANEARCAAVRAGEPASFGVLDDDSCHGPAGVFPLFPHSPAAACRPNGGPCRWTVPTDPCETREPTKYPTRYPTKYPTRFPTKRPTRYPTRYPTPRPTKVPTKRPTPFPTTRPTPEPTPFPTEEPCPGTCIVRVPRNPVDGSVCPCESLRFEFEP